MRHAIAPAFAVACVASLCWVADLAVANAETIEVTIEPGKRFAIELPAGLCNIDAGGHEADRTYFTAKAKSVLPDLKLLATFGDCPSLNALRSAHPQGESVLQRTVQVFAMLQGDKVQQMPQGLSRAKLVESFAKLAAAEGYVEGSVDISFALRDIERTPKGKETPPKELGVLARDSEALFTGLLWREELDGGKSRLMASVIAMSAIDAYPVSMNFIRPFAGRDGYDALIAEARRALRSVTPVREK
jgi:hypothetical protein